MTRPSLREARASIGLKTPSPESNRIIWSRVVSPTAGIHDGYTPLPSMQEAHNSDTRGVGVSGGWRAGKSTGAGMHGLGWLPYAQLIWLVAKDYDMSRQEFTYLVEGGLSTGLVNPKDIHMSINKYQPCALRSVTGCVVETRSLMDFRKIAARPPDLVIVCEPGLIDNLNEVMELLWGRVSEKRGQIMLAGTSDESSEEWYELLEEWQDPNNLEGGAAFQIPTWENHYRYPGGIEDPVFTMYRAKYGEEQFMSHFGGRPASPRGLVLKGYWTKDMVDSSLEHMQGLPLEIAVDPNYSQDHRYSVEFIQWDRQNTFLIDEIAVEGETHDEVLARVDAHPLRPYIQGGVLDPFAGESHVYGAPAPVSYWRRYHLRCDIRPRVNTTVQALKELMTPNTDGTHHFFVSDKCERFIYEANRWRTGKSGKPNQDPCDATKAVGYWKVDQNGNEHGIVDSDNLVAGEWEYELV